MAASDKNIVILPQRGSATLSPSVVFTGDGANPISIYALDGAIGSLSVEGSAGQLFSVTNNLTTGSIFSVNDVSGIPSLDVNAQGVVSIAAYGGNVGIGTTNPGAKLDVYGGVRFGGTTNVARRVDITTDGIITLAYGNNANSSNLVLQNASDTGSTTNHGNSILWQFGTSTTTAPINAGEVKIAKEQQWTTTATTQDSYFSVNLALDGVIGEKIRVTSAGSVGIGTTNPVSKLDVNGGGAEIHARNIGTAGSVGVYASDQNYFSLPSYKATIIRKYGTSETGNIFSSIPFADLGTLIFQNTTNGLIYTNGGSPLIFGTSSTEAMRIDASQKIGIGTTSPQAQLHITGQFQSTQANSTTTGGGQIFLNGATGNRIDFNNNGVAAPAFTTRSAGTKLVLYPSISVSAVDYALGIENATLWYSIPSSVQQHRWYAGTTQLADLKGTGEFLLGSTTLTGTASQPLQVTGGAYVSGNLGIGRTNPLSNLHVSGTGSFPCIVFPDTTNSRFSVGFGNVNVSGVGQRLDFYAGDSGSNTSNLNSSHLRMSLTATGNLGIGTTNPISPLEVSQDTTVPVDFTITNSNTGNNITKASRIRFRLTDLAGTKKDVAYITAYTYNLDSSAGNYLSFFTRTVDATPTEKMRLDKDGNLVLGSSFTPTGTASQPLQVNGGAYVSENLIIGTSGKLLVGALGTAALPIISFLNDPNTGIFSPGADQVSISTGGTVKLTVGSLDGNPIIENNFPTIRPTLDLAFAATKRLDPRVTFTRASSGTFVGSNGLLQSAANDAPRFDHNPTTGESLGLLVEEQRTNLLTGSQDFSNTFWSSSSSTRSNNNSTAPNGTTTACLVTGSGFTYGGLVRKPGFIFLPSTTYTISCFARAGTHDHIGFRLTALGTSADNYCRYNLTTGVATAITPNGGTVVSVSMQPFPNGYYQCVMVYTTSASQPGTGDIIDIALVTNTGNHNFTATGNVVIWGAQLEVGAFPTSYIPTTTAAATRSADVASITGSAFTGFYRQDEGTVFIEAAGVGNISGATRRYVETNNSTTQERIILGYSSSTNTRMLAVSGGINQADITVVTGINVTSFVRMSSAYRVNDFQQASNGTLGTQDTIGTVPVTDRMFIGDAGGSGTTLNGTLKRICYWPQRLGNQVLQSITQ